MSDLIESRLSPLEAMATWIAAIRALENGCGQSGSSGLTAVDEKGISVTFHIPNFMARKMLEADPEAIECAQEYRAASGMEAAPAGETCNRLDPKGDSPTAESGDAQPPSGD